MNLSGFRIAVALALFATSSSFAGDAPAAASKSAVKPFNGARPVVRGVIPDATDSSNAPVHQCNDSGGNLVNCCIDNNGNYVPCSNLSNVSYYHYKTVTNPLIWAIFWTNKVDATTQAQIGGFYTAVTNSEMFDWAIEYNTDALDFGTDPGSTDSQFMGRGVYAGAYTINPTTTSSTTVSDSDIENELKTQMDNGQIPQPDDRSIFMVYFPPGYKITQSGGDASCVKFCAYHSTTLYGSQNLYYGVFPDLGSGGCDGVCGSQSTVFKNICSASTHELFETISDGEVGLIKVSIIPPRIGPGYAWNAQPNGNEIGDMCNQFTDTINSIVDGTEYTVQQEFSQNLRQCLTSYAFVNDFRFFVNPTLVVISPGGGTSVPVTSEVTAGGPPSHQLSIDGSLTGVTVAFDKTTLAGDDSTELRITAAADTPLNTQTEYILTAQGPTDQRYVTRTAGLMVRVEPAPVEISLTGVTDGGRVHGTVSLRATATAASSSSLYFVALYIDGHLVTSDPTAATFSWDTSGLAAGSSHTVTAFAEDLDGGNLQITDTVVVQGQPTVSITAPTNGATVSGTVTVTAAGAAPAGTTIANLTVTIDGTSVATGGTSPQSYSWNTTAVTNGAHTIAASITDADGTSANAAPVTVTVHNLPTIAFTAPTAATVAGLVPIALTAAPVHGGTIGTVVLNIDGTKVANGTLSMLTYNWDTSALANHSSHLLSATVTDTDTATATATDTVSIKNGPVVTITAPGASTTVSDGSTIQVNATAVPASGTTLTSLSLTIDGTQAATGSAATVTAPWNTAMANNGIHNISAIGVDADGAMTTASVIATVKNPPSVSISFPSNGTVVTGSERVTASATIPPGTTLATLALLVDNVQVASATSTPATLVWDSTMSPNGRHVLTAVVTDADGTTATSAAVNVSTSNDSASNNFTLSISPAVQTISIGGTPATFTVVTGGASQQIALSVSSLPAGVTSSFSSSTVTAGQSSTLSLTAPAGTSPSSSTVFTVTGTSTSLPTGRAASATITVEPGAESSGCASPGGLDLLALLGLIPLLRRRRMAGAV